MHKQQLSDALVFFGATGDLAYKKIFPALMTLLESGQTRYACRRRGEIGLGTRTNH